MDERISQIIDELAMAFQWHRPCIVMAVYRSELVFSLLRDKIEREISASGQGLKQIQISSKCYDIPLILLGSENRKKTVFLVTGFRWGGGRGRKNAYKALNIHREHLIDSPVRVILGLTPKEAVSLAQNAPDFWAFRHRVFEFLELPSRTEEIFESRDITLGKWGLLVSTQNSYHELSTYEKLIAELPPLPESRRLEAEYHEKIGALLWANQDYSQAQSHLEKSLKIAQNIKDQDLQKEYYAGLGIIHQSMGNYAKAAAAYQMVIQFSLNDFPALVNLASSYLGMGNFVKAEEAVNLATKIYPKYPDAWFIRGNIYHALGCYEDAVDSYRRAMRLAPDDIRPRIHLGEVFSKWGNPKLASRYLASD